jgi:hypothetical protein
VAWKKLIFLSRISNARCGIVTSMIRTLQPPAVLHYDTYAISHITHVPSELALTASAFELDIRIQDTGPRCPCRIPSSFWYMGLIPQMRTWIREQRSNKLSLYIISNNIFSDLWYLARNYLNGNSFRRVYVDYKIFTSTRLHYSYHRFHHNLCNFHYKSTVKVTL